ncbi:Mitochondrial ATPase complex subunit atp10 [Saitozyma podzolica]|uniref:Mitochondrial ATPase complex subunit atp10 n=1 Tax=Saitozyma podzolica TaxID=1890683 RepID=A0A427XRD8_9TREE|nr:Mitochondrial ATPase complex subunit atp10 [Saitozyma podzolica]
MAPRLALRALRYLASPRTHTPLNALAIPLGAPSARLASTQPKADSPAPPSTPSPSSSVTPAAPSSSSSSTVSRQTPADASASTQAGPSKTADRLAIPPLSRPPGVPNPPTAIPKSWSQRKDELLDEERHKAKRKALVKEATQGYFHDYNRARSANGGKLWTAPPVLIREDRALYFPDISGKSLLSTPVHTTSLLANRTSLVTLLSTRISEEHVQSFISPVLEDWSHRPGFQLVQINHQDNPLKSMLLTFFLSSLKRTVPEERWGSYIVSSGAWSAYDVTGPLGIENRLLGYVFLVDHNLKVRWAGCGPATPKETEDLRTATAVLMRRMQETQGEKSKAEQPS